MNELQEGNPAAVAVRFSVIDDGVSERLTLMKEPNIVRCAILNGGGATDVCARFLDAGEKP